MKKVLITDYVHPVLIKNFQNAGMVCDYFPDYKNEDVYEIITDYYGIIINSKTKNSA